MQPKARKKAIATLKRKSSEFALRLGPVVERYHQPMDLFVTGFNCWDCLHRLMQPLVRGLRRAQMHPGCNLLYRERRLPAQAAMAGASEVISSIQEEASSTKPGEASNKTAASAPTPAPLER